MTETKGTNLTWHVGEVPRETRERIHGHRGATLWLTGLSGSGKSTLSHRVEKKLIERGVFAYVLDGDNVRHGLNKDLGFSPEARVENIRRVAEVAKLFTEAGAIVITAFISPYRADRDLSRALFPTGDFVEIHVAASLEVCESRDPKGLYKKARAGQIPDFTGISAPYEAPSAPELVVDTGAADVDACADQVLAYLEQNGYLAGKR
jgi:adenylylsulfate kinase